jgi:hypothetical protein
LSETNALAYFVPPPLNKKRFMTLTPDWELADDGADSYKKRKENIFGCNRESLLYSHLP